jgi:hypothetical protein
MDKVSQLIDKTPHNPSAPERFEQKHGPPLISRTVSKTFVFFRAKVQRIMVLTINISPMNQ